MDVYKKAKPCIWDNLSVFAFICRPFLSIIIICFGLLFKVRLYNDRYGARLAALLVFRDPSARTAAE